MWLIFWLVILIIMIAIELIRTNMTTIFFAGGALVAAIVTITPAPVWVSFVAFAVISFLLFAFVRPSVKRSFDRSHRSAKNQQLIGMRGFVTSQIDNLRGIGLVRVEGREFSATSQETNVIIPEGAIIKVLGIRGDKLRVCLDESMEDNMELRASDALLDPRLYDR